MWMQGGVDEDDRLDRAAANHVLRRSFALMRPYRRQLLVAAVLVVLYTASVLAGPLLVRTGIDDGIKVGDRDMLDRTVIAYIVVAVLAYFVYRFQVVTISRIGENFLRDLRIRVFDHLQRLSMPFYDREKAGVVVSRMTSDIDSLQELVQMGLLMFVSNSLLLVASVVVLAVVSWKLLLLCLLALPFVVVASIRFQRESNVAYLDVRDGIGTTLSHMQEGFSGVRVVQAFAREDVESTRFAAGQPRALRGPHAVGEDLGLVPPGHRDRGAVDHGRRRRHRRLVGASGRPHHRHGHVLRPHALEPLRTDPAAQSAVQHGAVGRSGPREAVRPARHRRRRPGAAGCGRSGGGLRHRGQRPGLRLQRRHRGAAGRVA